MPTNLPNCFVWKVNRLDFEKFLKIRKFCKSYLADKGSNFRIIGEDLFAYDFKSFTGENATMFYYENIDEYGVVLWD